MNCTSLTQTIRPWAVFASILIGLVAQAQTAAVPVPAPAPAPAPQGKEQKYERIVHEDGGSKVEEVRVGGQTQSITVQSKLGGEPYEIKPASTGKTDSATSGKAMWNIGKF